MKTLKAAAFLLGILCIAFTIMESCSKQPPLAGNKDYLEYKFQVGEQFNVSHYIIQVSTDGKTFEDAGMILASDNLDKYSILFEVTDKLRTNSVIYSRIVAVDKDGSIAYSKITSTKKT